MVIDSSASEHVVADINLFHSITDVEDLKVELASGYTVRSRHKSKVLVYTGTVTLVLSTVCFLSILQVNLSPCTRLDKYNIATAIFQKTCNLVDRENNDQNIAVIRRRRSDVLHTVEIIKRQEKDGENVCSARQKSKRLHEHDERVIRNLWHRRLVHANQTTTV